MTRHAIERALERLGLTLTFGDIRDIIDVIKAGKSVYFGEARGAEYHGITKHGRAFVAIYRDNAIMTVCTLETMTKRSRRIRMDRTAKFRKAKIRERQEPARMTTKDLIAEIEEDDLD